MEKVIIITRTQGYIENGDPLAGREEFAKAIQDRNNHQNYSDKNLRKFLSAIEFINKCQNVKEDFAKVYNITIGGWGIKKEDQIRKLLGSENFPNDDDRIVGIDGDCCYVNFHPSTDHDKEIILVLWDKLKRKDGKEIEEKVDCFELFIEAICKDCGVVEQSDDANKAILYVHDKQIGLGKECTLLHPQKDNLIPESWYNTLNKYFFYVASFQHSNDSVLFNRILKFDFLNPILSEKISNIERNSQKFSELRVKSDNIVEQYKERYQLKD